MDARIQPPFRGTEKETLLGFLQFLRATVIAKCSGLNDEQMNLTPTVSSMTLLGMVKHLTIVERYWFRGVFLDADVELPWSEKDPNGDWRTHESDTVAAVLEAYVTECQLSDQVVRDHDLGELAKWTSSEEERSSLRWILTHLIEEIARHCGHADILREAIDGVTGE